ncbi:M20/M25/M40 family metallo-hydrolase [Kineococcus sp. T13]|uniref:M20/M25/M40 family metallo-hydrolase n=1 Tax=Kineococcus vitellinus TaxID=2696565 RepID=UPI00141326F6|nr:M20/M25/M40 family metallo-hydrolase [Kineococcus vitellinus]NAZ75450.1 M20/M25/M40 family metallo-hydrolase [Kineococcus vitellinus]
MTTPTTPAGPASAAEELAALREHVDATRDELLEHLVGWVRIRSVSANPDNSPDMVRSAHWLAGVLRETGFPEVEVWRTDGAPAVFARWHGAPGAPTVLVYGHHDVRPVEDDHWEQCPPFEPALRDGRLWGRGTSDDKGQVLAHVWAVRAHLAATGRTAPAVNLTFLVEGEEESSSVHLAGLLEQERERLGADLVLLSDTMTWAADEPAVCTGVRGSISATLEVLGPYRDVHSGAVSGPAPNPVLELSRLLAQLHDEDGRITLPGFYDDVAEVSAAEREGLRALPWDEGAWLERSSTRSVGGERGFSVPERLYVRPAVEVTALLAGDPVGPSQGAIPSMATAEISFRTVPDQTVAGVAEQVRRWVAERIDDRFAYRLEVPEEKGQQPYVTPEDLPALAQLRAASEEVWQRPVGRMRNAGGSPAELLARSLGVPVLFFGTGAPEDNWHDSDESVSVDLLLKGVLTLARFWSRTGTA